MAHIRLHLHFLISRKMLLILAFCQLLCLASFLYAAGALEPGTKRDMFQSEMYLAYLNDSFSLVRFMAIVLGVLLSGMTGTKEYILYSCFVIRKRRDTAVFWMSKNLSAMLVECFVVYGFFIMFMVVGVLFVKHSFVISDIAGMFAKIALQAGFYIILTDLLMGFARHYFIVFVPLFICWLTLSADISFFTPSQGGIHRVLYMIYPSVIMKGDLAVLWCNPTGCAMFSLGLAVLSGAVFCQKDM